MPGYLAADGGAVLDVVHAGVVPVEGDQLLVVLRDGEIVERGRHEELVALDGHYARMHDIQHGPTVGCKVTGH